MRTIIEDKRIIIKLSFLLIDKLVFLIVSEYFVCFLYQDVCLSGRSMELLRQDRRSKALLILKQL